MPNMDASYWKPGNKKGRVLISRNKTNFLVEVPEGEQLSGGMYKSNWLHLHQGIF